MSDPGIEIAGEAAKAAAVEIIRPISEIVTDALGGLFADKVRNWRQAKPAWQERNQRDTAQRAAAVLAQRGVDRASDEANPVNVEEIIEACKDTSAPALKELYAKLVAAALDPGRVGIYRREFVGIAKELEPLDAVALPFLNQLGQLPPSRKEFIAVQLGRSVDQIELAFRNLLRLELIWQPPGGIIAPMTQPITTALGKQFLLAIE